MPIRYEFRNEEDLLFGFLSFVNTYAFVYDKIVFNNESKIIFCGDNNSDRYIIEGFVNIQDCRNIINNFDYIKNGILEKQEAFLKKRDEYFNNDAIPEILNHKPNDIFEFLLSLSKYSIIDYMNYCLNGKLSLYIAFGSGGASLLGCSTNRHVSWSAKLERLVLSYADDVKTYFIERCKEQIKDDWILLNMFKKDIEVFNPKNNNGYTPKER